VRELEQQVAERKVTLQITDAATDYLAEAGYDPDNGARPLARVMQEEVKRPLGEELLFGALENGGHVVIDVETTDGKKGLVFRYEKESKTPAHGAKEIPPMSLP
jgi:ATP-dependent Clp protease ATP-binding subunit ClpA